MASCSSFNNNNDDLCQGCVVTLHQAILRFSNNKESTREFLINHGVFPRAVKCPKCGRDCVYRPDLHQWYCNTQTKIPKSRKKRRCDFCVTEYRGTFFSGTSLPTWKIVLFVMHWLQIFFLHSTVVENLPINIHTSIDWRSFCAEVAQYWQKNLKPIGGEGIFVEIDETLIARRKYERGRILKQLWVFGGIERVTKRRFLVALGEGERRNKETLWPLIEKYIVKGSVIVSDKWKAYQGLESLGYKHLVINHSENFVDPANPDVHTQNIERMWRTVKSWIKRPGMQAQYLDQYLARYHFCTSFDRGQRLHQFFLQAAKLYPFGLTLDSEESSRVASQSKHRTGRDLEDVGSDEEGDLVVE